MPYDCRCQTGKNICTLIVFFVDGSYSLNLICEPLDDNVNLTCHYNVQVALDLEIPEPVRPCVNALSIGQRLTRTETRKTPCCERPSGDDPLGLIFHEAARVQP